MYCCTVKVVRHIALLFSRELYYVHSVCALMFQSRDFKTICVFNPRVEIALEVSVVLSGRVICENSRSR